MQSWQNVKLAQVQVGSNIAQNHSSSPWEVIFGHYLPQFTWKGDPKVKLGKVQVGLNIAQNHSSSP